MSFPGNASSRIFSDTEWQKLYPEKPDQKPEEPEPLYSLIARHHPGSDLAEKIHATQNPNRLVAHDPENHEVTPLIVAAMRGDEKAVEELLKKDIVKAHIDDTDEYGWSALHHAALTSDAIFQKLLAAGANRECRTKLGGSPADLKALTTPDLDPQSIANVRFEGEPLTKEKAETAFGIRYRDPSYFPPEFLRDLWQQEIPSAPDLLLQHVKERRKADAPQLEIVRIGSGFHGLVAAEPIARGTIIGEYGGVYRTNEHKFDTFPEAFPFEATPKDAYLFLNFDPEKVGNACRFINNGFPNVAPHLITEAGVNKIVFIAYGPIEKGEQLLFNYGGKSYGVTYGPEILFNLDKIHSFFKPGLRPIEKELRAITGSDVNSSLKKMEIVDRLNFALNNPICLIELHFSKTIDAKEWLKLLVEESRGWVRNWKSEQGLLVDVYLEEMLLRLIKIDQNIKKNAPNEYPLFENWVRSNCQKLPLSDLMKGMSRIEEALVNKKDPTLIDGIEEWLKTPEANKVNPYSYENRLAAFDAYLDRKLLQTEGVTDSNFFAKKAAQMEVFLKQSGESSDFAGSELEKMFHEVKSSLPKTKQEEERRLNQIKEEFKALQALL